MLSPWTQRFTTFIRQEVGTRSTSTPKLWGREWPFHYRVLLQLKRLEFECVRVFIVIRRITSDLYEGGSGHGGSFRHHHLALWPIVFWGIGKRLPIVPSRHGDKVTALRSPGKLIGHSSDLKRACRLNGRQLFGNEPSQDVVVWGESKWPPLTGSLHVLQFDVDVAGDVERQGCLAPGDHGSVDDTQGAASHRLPGFSQQIQGDGVCRRLTHLSGIHLHDAASIIGC